MSRDYGEFCPACKKFSARTEGIGDRLIVQCMDKDCACCFVQTRKYKLLKASGISQTAWQRAVREGTEEGAE